MRVESRNDAIQLATLGTVSGAIGGALGALAGVAVVWLASQATVDTDPTAVYPLASAPAVMAMVVAGVVATVVGILAGLVMGMAFGTMVGELLGRQGLVVLVVAALMTEAIVLLGLHGLATGREIGLTDFLWTAVLPALCASPPAALAAMAVAFLARGVGQR